MAAKKKSSAKLRPKVETIERDGDIPVRAKCTACGATFDAGSKHNLKDNSAELQRQWERHFKAEHACWLTP